MAGSSRRKLLARSAFLGCLVAAVSTLTFCGNAVWSAPPRFDGAGYAVLAQALVRGAGYRDIEHPDQPWHAHFPPGYSALLALSWKLAGNSVVAAHVVSSLCALGATLAAWVWFQRLLPRRSALVLALALAVNWVWARTASAIQSEPLYMFLSQMTILAAVDAARQSTLTKWTTVWLGTILAACLLTRHVALGLALAVWTDLLLRQRLAAAAMSAAVATLLVFPWVAWMTTVASTGQTQAGLLATSDGTWAERIASQLLFYIFRIPDQLTGPFVEVATVFKRSPVVAGGAALWAVLTTGIIVIGWAHCLWRPRRRLAGLVPLFTLGLLVIWPYTEAGRFLIPLVPCLLIGAEEGLAVVACWLYCQRTTRPRPSRVRLWAAIIVLLASLPYSCYMLVTGRTRALEATHRNFDAACAWIAAQSHRPGPVLSRHPGEVFWQTGRQGLEVATAERPGHRNADSDAIARTIGDYHVAFLLIDHARYAGAPQSPLTQFVADHPELVREVWRSDSASASDSISVYELSASP